MKRAEIVIENIDLTKEEFTKRTELILSNLL